MLQQQQQQQFLQQQSQQQQQQQQRQQQQKKNMMIGNPYSTPSSLQRHLFKQYAYLIDSTLISLGSTTSQS